MWRCFRVFAAACAVALSTGCSYPENADDWRDENDGGGTESPVSIAFVKYCYKGYPYTFTEDYRIRGIVVSTDRSGNYYKTLAVADDSGAIEVKVNCERLFEYYYIGTPVEIYCNGLTVGGIGGTVQLGASPSGGYETGYIDFADMALKIRITGEQAEVVPVKVCVADIDDSLLGSLVAVESVQFTEFSGEAWCDEDQDDPTGFRDTVRTVISALGDEIGVYTSRRAEFASWALPSGSGSIEGILSVYDGRYVLRVVRPDRLYDDMSSPRF